MEWFMDGAVIDDLLKLKEVFPISGVTTNPSLLKRLGRVDVMDHFRSLKSILATDSLHIQLVAKDAYAMLEEAAYVLKHVGTEVYLKIPTTVEGLKAMRELKKQGHHVTATGIYTKFQALMAIEAGVDYLATYVNRMINLDINAYENLAFMTQYITQNGFNAKIVAASFKNLDQVSKAIAVGVHALTLEPELYERMFKHPAIQQAVDDFADDFETVYGIGQTLNLL